MAYDTRLAARVRPLLAGRGRVEEKPMFGGLTFMLDGKMCCGVLDKRLMVRAHPERTGALLKRKGAAPMDFTGRAMKGYVFVGPRGTSGDAALKEWVDESARFVKALPAKRAKRK